MMFAGEEGPILFVVIIIVVVVAVLVCFYRVDALKRQRENPPPTESMETNRLVQLRQPARQVRRANGGGGGVGYMDGRQVHGGGRGHTGGTATTIRPSAPPPAPGGDDDLPPSYMEAIRQGRGGR